MTTLSKIFLVIIGATANVPIQFVGTIRLGEIISLIAVIVFYRKIAETYLLCKPFKTLTLFFLLWLVLGVLSTLINTSEHPELYRFIPPATALAKGVSNVLFVYFGTAVFIGLTDDQKTLNYFLWPYGLSAIVFSPFCYSIPDAFANNILTTSPFTVDNYFDVCVSPVIYPLVIAFSNMFPKRISLIVILFSLFGALAVYFDAKSTGLVFVLCAIVLVFSGTGMKLSRSVIIFWSVFSPLILFPLLLIVAQAGFLGIESSEKIAATFQSSDKFNPFLIVSRPDAVVALYAISDNPIIGHGFNKQDRSFISSAAEDGYVNIHHRINAVGIPAHSNLLGAMVEGGILAGAVWFFVLYLAYRTVEAKLIGYSVSPYELIGAFYLLWNVLFSDTLRLDIGHIIAILCLKFGSAIQDQKIASKSRRLFALG